MAYEPRGGGGGGGDQGDGPGRSRGRRPVTDYNATVNHWMHGRRPRYQGSFRGETERPSPSYVIDMLPPSARIANPADTIPVKHLHQSLNKIKHPINVVRWTPEGRRLLTGSASGEFTLWNGTGFNFETIMQAHDRGIRAMEYSHSDDWLLSADDDGIIKYWQPNFNNVQSINGHKDPIRDLAFSPTDAKFVTASDDASLKIFDFAGGVEEATLTGHGWDAKSVDWHPTKGLLISGSKDHLVKLWDPRTGRCLTTLHSHKNTITKTVFEKVRGLCFATSARDLTARIFDLRMMRDICLLKGQDKDISTVAFHPLHSNLVSTGCTNGSIFHYILDEPNRPDGNPVSIAPYDSADPASCSAQAIFPAHRVPFAHEGTVWSLDWHPLGHILASGSNDRITRFWTRSRPGETEWQQDRYHIGDAAAEAQGTFDRRGHRRMQQAEEEQQMQDEAEGLVDQSITAVGAPAVPGIPGLPNLPGIGASAIPGVGGAGHGPVVGLGIAAGATASSAGGAPPLPLPGHLPFPLPGMTLGNIPPPPMLPGLDLSKPPPDISKIAEMMKQAGMQLPPPPLPGMPLPPGLLPPGFPLPQGVTAAPNSMDAEAARRRAPLPSQEESLRAEQSRGNYTRLR